MTVIESRELNYTVISSPTSSSVFDQEEIRFTKSNIIAPLLFSLMTITAVPGMSSSDISAISQPVTVCQTIDIAEPMSNEMAFKKFVSKLVTESRGIDPEIAEIVNKNYRDLLW